jgi:hypothetical protein
MQRQWSDKVWNNCWLMTILDVQILRLSQQLKQELSKVPGWKERPRQLSSPMIGRRFSMPVDSGFLVRKKTRELVESCTKTFQH